MECTLGTGWIVLSNRRRLQAKTKAVEKLIVEPLFADDCALLAHSDSDLQVIVDSFSNATKLFGLTTSMKKTEAIYQPVPGIRPIPSWIIIDGAELSMLTSSNIQAVLCPLMAL